MQETRVGYVTTSFLESLCEEYILAHIIDKVYVGELHYLQQYISLKEYNQE